MLHVLVGLLFGCAGLVALGAIGLTILGEAGKIAHALGYAPAALRPPAPLARPVALRRRAPARPVPGRPASPTRAAA